MMAARAGAGDLKMASLGVSKAGDERLRDLVQMLVKDHTSLQRELKKVAEELKIPVTDAPDAKAEERVKELGKKNGEEFDAALLKELAASHAKSTELYETGGKAAKQKEVKAHITATLPVLKRHAARIKELEGKR